jgi:hypothetical protein
MSASLLKAITFRLRKVEVLTGDGLEAQTALQALVPAANVRQGSFDSTVALPQITFRPSGGLTNPISMEQIGVIVEPEFDFEVWQEGRKGDTVAVIDDLINQLLDDRRGVANPMTTETGWKLAAMHRIMEPALLYDSTRNLHFSLSRYQAVQVNWKQGT